MSTLDQPLLDAWYLTGATAGGKSAVGLELARRLGAEIVSLDSMAVYRGMDIGTAKPTPEQRAAVPHHLLDLLEPTEEFSLSQYCEAAHRTAAEIRSRGKEVLFVGGTPLYLKGLLRGVFEGPPADWEFRRQVEAEVEQLGNGPLHERLMQIDPISAVKLHKNDTRRMIRALEVYRATGQPISHLQLQFEEPRGAVRAFVLSWPREEQHRRIEARVEAMFAAGLVEETAQLLKKHGALGRTAAQAVGYREVIAHLSGETSLEEARAAVKARTRQFCRRQETWFRGLAELRPIPMAEPLDPAATAEAILAAA